MKTNFNSSRIINRKQHIRPSSNEKYLSGENVKKITGELRYTWPK